MRPHLAVILGLVGGATLLVARPQSSLSSRARDFLATLSPAQRKAAVYEANAPERTTFMYVPGDRKGISWGEMTEPQQKAATHLLRGVLSTKGFEVASQIRDLENVLREMENNPSRDPNRYWFVFFGEPSDQADWAWRYEGHHLSLTFSSRLGIVASSTPQFLGSNPATVLSGPKKGLSVLAAQRDLGYALLESLTAEQRREAILEGSAPADILTGTTRVAQLKDHRGLDVKSLSVESKGIFEKLLQVHASIQAPGGQKRRLRDAHADPHVTFAWIGSDQKGAKHYYRIQGDTFLIEYDNTQNDANHIHTVWRDLRGDFGGDVLADHYRHAH